MDENKDEIATSEKSGGSAAGDSGGISRIGMVALGVAAVVAAGAIGYVAWDRAQGDEAPQAPAEMAGPMTIEQLKERADADPMNAEAWQELGFAYFQAQRFPQAAEAYRQAIEGDKENAVLWSALGEARVMSQQLGEEPLPADAIAAFERAIELDAQDPRARYFLAVRKDLAGDHQGAINDWLALLEDTPPNAPWEGDLRRTIEQVGKKEGIDTSAQLATAEEARPAAGLTGVDAIPGPSQEEIARAAAIRPSDQRDMAVGMTESLESKLQDDPNNIQRWIMLMRSRMVLGEPDKAARALQNAIAANPSEADRLRSEAELLGVPGA